MKLRFTLIYLLLFSALLLNAQPAFKKTGKPKKFGTLRETQKNRDSEPKTTKTVANISGQKSAGNALLQKKQNVTGIWKGYFVQNALGMFEDKYRFEVQVAEQNNHSLKAVTYSYKTTVFYGKAEATGIFTSKSKNFLLKELKLTDVKFTESNTEACLMTCYLDYDKIGATETLSGNYTSINIRDKSDCGNGKVFLEKSQVTDFYKEDFLVKRENELKNKEKALAKKASSKNATTLVAKNNLPKTPNIKPGAEENITKTTPKPKPETALPGAKPDPVKPLPPTVIKSFPKPEIMKTRENDLQKTFEISEKEFKIELYDNGEIDGDRISVYHNNELIVSDKKLTHNPITFTINADENSPVHDFVMVAENLGSIPPNTALMIITAGNQRYELFITSTNQKNAVVRVEYKSNNAK